MTVIRIRSTDELKPTHVVMVVLVAAVLAGSCLLTNGPRTTELHDGARAWQPNSVLRAVVQVLNVNYTQTTAKGVAIKDLVFFCGTGLAALVVGLSVAVGARAGEEDSTDDVVVDTATRRVGRVLAPGARHIRPWTAALLLTGMYVLWSWAQVLWSPAPDFAIGATTISSVYILWALLLAVALTPRAAYHAAWALLVVGVLTAVVAVWYYHERNPTLRASYPIGNPLFLAAVLLPGLLIPLGVIGGVRPKRTEAFTAGRVLLIVVMLCCIAIVGRAFLLAQGRGAAVALVAGMGAMVFLRVRRWGKTVLTGGCVVALAATIWIVAGRLDTVSPTGRYASIRARLFAWSYAGEMIAQRPLVGHGPGGYVLRADSYAANDVLADPQPLQARIAHAHNEWLEVLADGGSIGFALLGGGLALTFWAGALAVKRTTSSSRRWMLTALMGAMFALTVEECFSVGLRLPGLPAIFYTVWGLVWAMSTPSSPARTSVLARVRPLRAASALAGSITCVVILAVAIRDFAAARARPATTAALESMQWQPAVALARKAVQGRLNPQERLAALDGLCATHLYIATVHQASSFRRASLAGESSPPDPQLLELSADDRRAAEAALHAGHAALGRLLARAPGCWNSGWLEYGLYRVAVDFARRDRDEDAARSKMQAAADALKRELRRRPYDPVIALELARFAGADWGLAERFDVLARPLRVARLIPGYIEFLQQIVASPEFDEAFTPIFDNAYRTNPALTDVDWSDALAPEKLRLAAMVLFARHDYARAQKVLERAASLYDKLSRPAPVANSSCRAELADSMFLSAPDQPQAAVRVAERALQLAPRGEIGRRIALAVRHRMVAYHLAANEEETARRLLETIWPRSLSSQINARLAAQYTQVVRRLMHRPPDRSAPDIARWMDRALTLNPSYPLAWLTAGEVAFRQGDDQRCAQRLQRALQTGAPLGAVTTFLEEAIRQRPESNALNELQRALAQGAAPIAAPAGESPEPSSNNTVPARPAEP